MTAPALLSLDSSRCSPYRRSTSLSAEPAGEKEAAAVQAKMLVAVAASTQFCGRIFYVSAWHGGAKIGIANAILLKPSAFDGGARTF